MAHRVTHIHPPAELNHFCFALPYIRAQMNGGKDREIVPEGDERMKIWGWVGPKEENMTVH